MSGLREKKTMANPDYPSIVSARRGLEERCKNSFIGGVSQPRVRAANEVSISCCFLCSKTLISSCVSDSCCPQTTNSQASHFLSACKKMLASAKRDLNC